MKNLLNKAYAMADKMAPVQTDDDHWIVKVISIPVALTLTLYGLGYTAVHWPLIGIPLLAFVVISWSIRIGWWLVKNLIIRPVVRAGLEVAREEKNR